ncbi:MAG: hypothetical protein M1840_007794 [Geoglossum simile]|nr:MAG: hypothetical protein M1840_007794 [Geoglossum simile]
MSLPAARFDSKIRSFLSWSRWPDPQLSIDQLIMDVQGWSCWSIRRGSPAETAIDIRHNIEVLRLRLSTAEPAPIDMRGMQSWMVGKSPDRAYPTIVFCHRSERIRTSVRDIIRKYGKFAPGVLVNSLNTAPTELAAKGEPLDPVLLDDSVYRTRDSENPCGARIVVKCQGSDSLRRGTLGGILLVEGKVRGITVDHAFQGQSPLSDPREESALAFDEDPGNPISFFSPRRWSRNPTPARKTSTDAQRLEISECQSQLGTLAYKGGKPLSSKTRHDGHDWALIEIEDQGFIIANEVLITETVPPKHIWPQDIVKGPLIGKVWAATGSGNTEGQILGSTSYVQTSSINELVEVPTVLLARPLEPGDCGSWLLEPETGNVFGHIVAGLPGTRLAYAISAENIFTSIKSMTNSSVFFPTKLDIAAITGNIKSIPMEGSKSQYLDFTISALSSALCLAVLHHREEMVQFLIGGGADVNVREDSGRAVLYRAAESGDWAIVKLLASVEGIEVNSKNNGGRTPLWQAAANGHEAVTKLLIGIAGIDINSRDSAGQTPLWQAAANGHEAVVKLMVSIKDTEVNSGDRVGRTPLWQAAAGGHEAVVKLLASIERIDVNAKDKNGRTPLWQAAAEGHEGVIKLLASSRGIEVNSEDTDGRTPLSQAAASGREAAVKLLVGVEGIEVNSKDSSGWTPLWQAVANRHEAVIKLLAGVGGTEVNPRDKDGQTPLWQAAANGHEVIVRLLVNIEGVEVDSKDKYDRTPLWQAIANGHHAVTKLLVNVKGVDVNCKDKRGWTLLWQAAVRGHKSIFELLLGAEGVDVNAKDTHGRTLLSWAITNKRETVVRIVIGVGSSEVDSKDKDGRTLLWRAAANGDEAIVKLLIGVENVQVNSRDNNGRTPLWQAAANGHEAVVKLLVSVESVELNCRDESGRTPLWQAAANGHGAVVELLVGVSGVDVDSRDKDGRTPRWQAATNGHRDVVELLERP